MPAPRMPRHTCPLIDRLKRRIEKAFEIADGAGKEQDPSALLSMLKDIRDELYREAEALEDIRDANLALRNCAEYWQEEAERLEALSDA